MHEQCFHTFFCDTNISSEISTEYSICNSTSGSFCYPRSVNAREAFSCLSSGVSVRNLTSVVREFRFPPVTLPTELGSPVTQEGNHWKQHWDRQKISNLFHFIPELTKGQSLPFLTSALGKLLRMILNFQNWREISVMECTVSNIWKIFASSQN